MKIGDPVKPLARKQGLVVKEASGEVLIYDLDRNKAHCLNETAASVWKNCNGQHDVEGLAKLVTRDLKTPVDENVIWFALTQLSKDHLLETEVVAPGILAGMNRRDVIKALGIAAVVAVPVVTSIVAPTPAQAVSCRPPGDPCGTPADCCSGLCNTGTCG